MRWRDDPNLESVLRELKLSHEIRSVPIAEIDFRQTEENLGRIGRGVNRELVEDYALAMMVNGDVFPRPAVVRFRKKLVLAAGMHRTLAAKEAGATEIECYFVEIEREEDLLLLSVMSNAKEGSRVSRDDRVELAVSLVEGGARIVDVCRRLRLSTGIVQFRARANRTQKRLQEAGLGNFQLSCSTLEVLGRLKNDKAMVAAAEAARKHSISSAALEDIIKPALAKRTEAQQIATIEEEVGRWLRENDRDVDGQPRPIRLAKRTKFLRTLHALQRLLTDDIKSLKDLGIERGTDGYQQIVRDWNETKRRCDALLSAKARA